MNHGGELSRAERFGQMVIHACGKTALTVHLECIGRDRNNRHRSHTARLLVLTNAAPGFKTINEGHLTIHQYQIENLSVRPRDGSRSAINTDHLQAHLLEHLRNTQHAMQRGTVFMTHGGQHTSSAKGPFGSRRLGR